MSDETSRARSPNSPRISLGDALLSVEALYKKAGRAPIKAEIAAQALGYAGLTGSSATLLGALNQYGLVDRTKGDVQVTQLAIRIIHPLGPEDKLKAMRESALSPKAFVEIHERYSQTSEDVICNQLVHQGFAPEMAKRVASAYKANVALAKLDEDHTRQAEPLDGAMPIQERQSSSTPAVITVSPSSEPQSGVLATFRIPIGSAQAELTFTGEALVPEDFDALQDYILLFKKQYQRKLSTKNVASVPLDHDKT